MANPTISIIVPVYNVEPFLTACLNSIKSQSFFDFECIMVDDGSNDNSGSIIDSFSLKDKRFIAVHQENLGVSIARNKGLDCAKGKYISFVDSDDLLHPNFLSILYRTIVDSNSDISRCSYTSDIEELEFEDDNTNYTKESVRYYSKNMLAGIGIDGYLWNKLFKSNLIRDNSLRFVEGLSIWEDMLFLMEYYNRSTTISSCYQKLYYYRKRNNSALSELSITKTIDCIKAARLIYNINSIDKKVQTDSLKIIISRLSSLFYLPANDIKSFENIIETELRQLSFNISHHANVALLVRFLFLKVLIFLKKLPFSFT